MSVLAVSVLVSLVLILATGVLLGLRWTWVVVEVVGESMAPTFAGGERVLVRRSRSALLHSGDVVVFEEPDRPGEWFGPPGSGRLTDREWVVKRVVALPGDPVPEFLRYAPGVNPMDPVPPGSLLVVGDNFACSTDSRAWGYVLADRLLGTVSRRLGPSDPTVTPV